ncbi:MAG: YybH family protein [Tepidisphaeraceae bacterium]
MRYGTDRTASVAPSESEQGETGLREWLESFARAVREQDYVRGRSLFTPNVIAFGTRGTELHGIEALVADQWRPVWGTTRGFTFDLNHARIVVAGDTAWATIPWRSQGRRSDGAWFDRLGRATYILERRDGCWLAVHSHHSLNPA